MVTLESCSILFSRILGCYVEMLNTTQLCNSAVFRFPGFGLSKTLHALGTIIGKIPTKTTGPPTARHPSLGGSFKVSNLNSTSPTLVKPSAGHYNAISARAIVALYDFPGLIVRNPTRIQRPGIWMDLGHFSPQLICNKHQPARSGRSTVVKIPAAWVIWGVSWHSWHSCKTLRFGFQPLCLHPQK